MRLLAVAVSGFLPVGLTAAAKVGKPSYVTSAPPIRISLFVLTHAFLI